MYYCAASCSTVLYWYARTHVAPRLSMLSVSSLRLRREWMSSRGARRGASRCVVRPTRWSRLGRRAQNWLWSSGGSERASEEPESEPAHTHTKSQFRRKHKRHDTTNTSSAASGQPPNRDHKEIGRRRHGRAQDCGGGPRTALATVPQPRRLALVRLMALTTEGTARQQGGGAAEGGGLVPTVNGEWHGADSTQPRLGERVKTGGRKEEKKGGQLVLARSATHQDLRQSKLPTHTEAMAPFDVGDCRVIEAEYRWW